MEYRPLGVVASRTGRMALESEWISFSRTVDDQRVKIYLAGHLCTSTAPRLRGTISDLDEIPFRQLTIDMRAVRAIDIAGVRCLVAAEALAVARHARFEMINVSQDLHRGVLLAGLEDLRATLLAAERLRGRDSR